MMAAATCEVCGGTGFAIVSREGRDFAQPCACRRPAGAGGDALLALCRIPPRYEHCLLQDFVPGTPSQRAAKERAERYVAGYPFLGADEGLGLVERADVLIEGFRPGVAERLGFGPEACLARNPRLVFGRATGWGQDGELAPRAGHDINYLAVAGALHPIGRAGTPPVPPANFVADYGGVARYGVTGDPQSRALWQEKRFPEIAPLARGLRQFELALQPVADRDVGQTGWVKLTVVIALIVEHGTQGWGRNGYAELGCHVALLRDKVRFLPRIGLTKVRFP